MKDPVVAAVALLIAPLVWLPWPLHWRLRNTPVLFLIVWLSLGNAILGINAFIWWNDTRRRGDPWCDISIRLSSLSVIGSQSATLELSRKLLLISRARTNLNAAKHPRREAIIDVLMCVGIPVLQTTLATLYQGHRYDLVEAAGCTPPVYQSWPYIVFGILPPVALTCGSFVMSMMALTQFLRKRSQLNAVLQTAGSSFSKGRFIRLVALTSAEAAFGFPATLALAGLTITNIAQNPGLYRPYVSWAYVHTDYWRVLAVPASYWNSVPYRQFSLFDLSRWVLPMGGLIFFGLFATTRECRSYYADILASMTPSALRRDQVQSFQPAYSAGTTRQESYSLNRTQSLLSKGGSTSGGNSDTVKDYGIHIEEIVLEYK